MFKKLISFATILLAISFNNSESSVACTRQYSSWHFGFDQDSYSFFYPNFSFTNKLLYTFVNAINYGINCLKVDSVDYENDNKKVIFKGVKTLKTCGCDKTCKCKSRGCEYLKLEGLNGFKPDIVFDCGNNKVKFTKIVGNNINSFKFISKNPIKIKSWISVDTTNNKMKVYNTKNKPIIGAITVTPPYSYFVLSLKDE